MLQPSLDGLLFWLILVIITVAVWIWNLYKYKANALLLFGSVALLSVLIFQVLDHWLNSDADNLIGLLLAINLGIAVAAARASAFLNTRYLVISFVIVIALHSIFHLFLRDNLKLYLTMRLSSDRPSINLYYWADKADIQTNWKDIYETWPDNELLLREAVMTYLLQAYNNSTSIYRNTTFRDATFEAWAGYNSASSTQRLDFSGSTYYEDCAMNADFMQWWTSLAVSDKRHEPGLVWFLGVLKDHLQYCEEEELSKVEQTLKACQPTVVSDIALTALLNELLTVIEAKRGAGGE